MNIKTLEILQLDYDRGTIYVVNGEVDNFIHANDDKYEGDYLLKLLKQLGVNVERKYIEDLSLLDESVLYNAAELGYEDYD